MLDFCEKVTKPNSKHTCNSKVSSQNIHILEPNASNALKVKANAAHGVWLCECVCKLQYNSFSIPLASDGRVGAKRGQFLLVFDTQITSIREEKAASIFVFTFDALPDAGCDAPDAITDMPHPHPPPF